MKAKKRKRGWFSALQALTKKSTMEELELALKEGGVEMEFRWWGEKRVWIVVMKKTQPEFCKSTGIADKLERAIVAAATGVDEWCEAEAEAEAKTGSIQKSCKPRHTSTVSTRHC